MGAADSGAHRTAIIVAVYDPGYLRIMEHQVRSELALGRRPLVIDTSATSAAPVDTYDRGILRLFGLPYPGKDLRDRVGVLGADYARLDAPSGALPSERLSADLEEALAISVQSALISYFRTDQPDRSKRLVGRIAVGLEREGRTVFREITAALAAHPEIDTVILPNGRYPGQKMAMLAAERSGVNTWHFEKGETPNGTYLQDYAPQNRLRSQGSVTKVLAGRSDAEIAEIAQAWLSKRAPSDESRNEFSAGWRKGFPGKLREQLDAGSRTIGFFTSSQDEFQFLGPEWQLHDWADQFEAFDRILSEVERTGAVCYLRVHPNLATKAQDCFVRERAGIRSLAARHPELIVVWHDEPVSTYSLLDVTDAVVVWDSTVGLEASARGLPVWTTATSRYGLVADVQERLSAASVSERGLEDWEVNRQDAYRFIAYLVLRDQQMSESFDSWVPWDRSRPPLAARVATAFVSGGTPYRREALRSIVDVYRHRSLRANIAHLRRR